MHFARGLIAASGLVVWVYATPAGAAIIGGQVDTFEDGTLQNWQNGGFTNPNPATNVATGGPGGANDNYLRVASNGGAGAGGKLVVFNSNQQWAGDYLDADVGSIAMQVNNFGATNLTLRLILLDGLGGQTLTTVAPVNVPAGSGWTDVSFSLAPANLTGGNFATAMDSITELNLVHSPTVIAARSGSPNITAQLGVDNITAVAVPEPGAGGAALLAAAGWTGIRRRRARIGCGGRAVEGRPGDV
jgi:hypothetical protein